MKKNWELVVLMSLFTAMILMAVGTDLLLRKPKQCPVCLYKECPQLVYPLEVAELIETMDGSVVIGEDIDTHVGEDLVGEPTNEK